MREDYEALTQKGLSEEMGKELTKLTLLSDYIESYLGKPFEQRGTLALHGLKDSLEGIRENLADLQDSIFKD
jgi:hypothetical protein